MNALALFVVLSALPFWSRHFAEADSNGERNSQNKSFREVEPFTNILLDNESFSIAPKAKHPVDKSSVTGRKDGFKRIANIHPGLKAIKGKKHSSNTNTKLHHAVRLSVKDDVVHSSEMLPKSHQDKQHAKSASLLKKKLHKRHFEPHIGYHNKYDEVKREEIENDFGPTYRFVLTEATKFPKYFHKSQAKSFATTANIFDVQSLTSNQKEIFEDLNANPWENAERFTTGTYPTNVVNHVPSSSSLTPTWSESSDSKRDSLPNFSQNSGNLPDSWLRGNMKMIPDMNNNFEVIKSTVPSMTRTVPPVHSMAFHQADIIQRNLAKGQQHKKTEADNLAGYEPDYDDTVITFDGTCDQIVNETCCVQREVGDVLTLAVKIKSSRKPSSFQIRWMKVYHKYDSNKGKPLEIDAGKLPWNMVSGSEGRQLRLNPVTNSDTDPNCFVAKVFLITKNRGKLLFTQLKKLIYRIEIPIIDMGKIYAGEELSINIENFISLPERGNLLFQWNLETKPQEYESLPSNIKVSSSGRSVILKELKKGRLGVLNCVVYSSNRYAVAKRRFNILNIFESVRRRSARMDLEDDPLSHDLLRSHECQHVIRRSQEKAKQMVEDGNKPKSRRKRFRRTESVGSRSSVLDCESLRKRMYFRFVRSLFRELTTEDPRLMPLEKLFELSEEGDGTLDDVIPHEVHYVSPKVKMISGTSAERSADHPVSTNCTAHADCVDDAVCVFSEEKANSTVRSGNCYCRPEFYRDGNMCRKIPSSNHREKRLKRNARNDFAVPRHLFYENSREIVKSTPETLEVDEDTGPPKVLAFEEEESFLLTDCIDDKDCSIHSNCVQPTNGHPYCKCRPGFRGNGIFCWEIMDYVPSEEQFLTDEEMDTFDQPLQPGMPVVGQVEKTAEPQAVDDV